VPLPIGTLPEVAAEVFVPEDVVAAAPTVAPAPAAVATVVPSTDLYHSITLQLLSSCVTFEDFSKFLPTKPRERNGHLFDLARYLKSIMPNATLSELEPIVRAWHAAALPVIKTKEWETSWKEFWYIWHILRHAFFGRRTEIVNTAQGFDPLGFKGAKASIARLCVALQSHHGPGNSWPLSSRLAGEAADVHYVHAARILKTLQADGVLEMAQEAGSYREGRAAEYRLIVEPVLVTGQN